MSQKKYCIIVFCSLILIIDAASIKLPKYFTKCNIKDPNLNECALKNIQDNWNTFVEGDSYYHIQKLKPLFVPLMQMKVDENLTGNLTNGYIHGMDTFKFPSVSLDLENKLWKITYSPEISYITGPFISKGKLFGLPVSGGGLATITFHGGIYTYIMLYDLNEKNGKQYIHINNSSMDYDYSTIKKVNFQLKINGSVIGEIISDTLNENWREVGHDLAKSFSKAIAGIFSIILNDFFSRVAFGELFSNDVN